MKVHNVTGLTLDIQFLWPSHIRVLLDVQTKNEDEDKQKYVEHHDDEVVAVIKKRFYSRNS